MPDPVTESTVIAGFYGKLPARGDFIRVGLTHAFTDPWDDWLRIAIAGSRERMGEDWLPAYLESPIWRFTLPAGLCGTQPVVGLMLPSVDKAGRYFPLTFAALCDAGSDTEAWLDRCEEAGFAALEQDLSPDAIAAMIAPSPTVLRDRDRTDAENHESVWWTQGSPRVSASRLVLPGLPDAAVYAAMLGEATDQSADGPVENESVEEASWEPRS